MSEEHIEEINHPSHYNQGGIEVIEVIKLKSTSEEFIGYLQGNVIKYLLRYKYKGKQVQDLEKCKWYLAKMIEEVQECLEE